MAAVTVLAAGADDAGYQDAIGIPMQDTKRGYQGKIPRHHKDAKSGYQEWISRRHPYAKYLSRDRYWVALPSQGTKAEYQEAIWDTKAGYQYGIQSRYTKSVYQDAIGIPRGDIKTYGLPRLDTTTPSQGRLFSGLPPGLMQISGDHQWHKKSRCYSFNSKLAMITFVTFLQLNRWRRL